MKIKKYEVANMKEALSLIKQDLGPEAVILSTRKVMRNNNFGLFARPVLEVTAAIDYKEPVAQKNPRKPQAGTPYGEYATASSVEEQAPKKRTVNHSVTTRSKPEPDQYYETSQSETQYFNEDIEDKYTIEPAYSPQKRRSVDFQPQTTQVANEQSAEKLASLLQACGLDKFHELLSDIGEIKKQINDMKVGMAEHLVVDLPMKLKSYFNIFVKNGVDNLIAYRFLKRVEKRVTPELSNIQIKELITDMLVEIISIGPDYASFLRKRIITLVGPTGVGKTTTIAKIAAALTLKHKLRVCLITVDNFRIGAVEQLKTYAEIVNIPLYVATSSEEFKRIMNEAHDKYDTIMVDSMGRSQFDSKQIDNIGTLLKSDYEVTVALVLSLAANHKELADTLDRYMPLSPDYLIFTKLDETKYFGPLINLPIMKRIPLLLVTTGQNVPDDMEVPNGKKIAKKVLQEIPSLWSVK